MLRKGQISFPVSIYFLGKMYSPSFPKGLARKGNVKKWHDQKKEKLLCRKLKVEKTREQWDEPSSRRKESCRKQEKLCIFSIHLWVLRTASFFPSLFHLRCCSCDVNGKSTDILASFYYQMTHQYTPLSTEVSDLKLSNILALTATGGERDGLFMCTLANPARAHVRIFC